MWEWAMDNQPHNLYTTFIAMNSLIQEEKAFYLEDLKPWLTGGLRVDAIFAYRCFACNYQFIPHTGHSEPERAHYDLSFGWYGL